MIIIHQVRHETVGERIRLSAKIETTTGAQNLPETAWFEFPKKYRDVLSSSMNGFVASIMPVMMALKEDVRVRGNLSPRLLYGLHEYQKVLNFWYPTKLSRVSITADEYRECKPKGRRGAMTAFSGGVDSSYTLLSHLPKRERMTPHQVTHAMLVHGFDIPLSDTNTFAIVRDTYERALKEFGIELLPVATNIKEFSDRRGFEWVLSHSAAVVGTALFFEPIISNFYFPLNDTVDNALPSDGLHPTLVPLLSTATLASLPHGGTVSKLDKIRTLGDWPSSYHTLRVCWEHPDGMRNCGACWKCIYTMTYLEMAGTRSRYSTFASPFTRKKVRNVRFYQDLYYYYRWLWRDALSVRRYDIAFDYTIAMIKSYVKNFKTKRVKCYYYPNESSPTEATYY